MTARDVWQRAQGVGGMMTSIQRSRRFANEKRYRSVMARKRIASDWMREIIATTREERGLKSERI